jgi:chromate transporter
VPTRVGDQDYEADLGTVLREWGRIGVTGFGGPPTHIALLRKLCVDSRGWLDAAEFEDAIAACNLLPGPASTELAIFCAWRVRGRLGAIVGGLAFIVPGLIVILFLSALFLGGSPPLWVRGAGAGAGAAVAAVAVQAGSTLLVPSWKRASARDAGSAHPDAGSAGRDAGSAGPDAGSAGRARAARIRWTAYLVAGGASAATIGPWLVLVLLGCGLIELAVRQRGRAGPRHWRWPGRWPGRRPAGVAAIAPLFPAVGGGVLAAVAWVAFKVGALSFGGGFVIIPLMQADAVGRGWMTGAQFLNAVALGQITPGPVVQTVAAVGYAAAGLPGGLLASAVAFTPSFVFVLVGGQYFGRLRGNRYAQSFLDGSGPAAIGAILGSAIPLARELSVGWQFAVLGGAVVLLLVLRRGVVLTLLSAAATGVLIGLAGGPLPG